MSAAASPSQPPSMDTERWIADDLASLRSKNPGHIPPVLDHNGFELKVHHVIENQRINKLHDVMLPPQWTAPSRFSTRSALRQHQKEQLRPSLTYDCDGDGFVGQNDYSIARKHDLASEGVLTGGQRASAIAEACYKVGSSLRRRDRRQARARRILTSLRDRPELNDAVRREQRAACCRDGGRVTQDEVVAPAQGVPQVLSNPAPQEYDGPVYTRTMLLARRRVEKEADEQRGHENFCARFGSNDG